MQVQRIAHNLPFRRLLVYHGGMPDPVLGGPWRSTLHADAHCLPVPLRLQRMARAPGCGCQRQCWKSTR